PTALNNREHGSLLDDPRSRRVARAGELPGLAAHVSLISLDDAVELRWPRTLGHGEANPVHEEQRRLVTDARLAMDLERADALLRAARAPEGLAPDAERDARVLEDGADPHRELL